MKKTSNLDEFAQVGIAALLPGMRFMLDLMTEAVSDKATLLSLMQQGLGAPATREKPGRPVGSGDKTQSGWPADPVERSIEMRRRMALAASRKTGVAPGTEAFAEKIRKARKKAWAKKTPAQRQAWMDAMRAGKVKSKRAKNKAARAARAARAMSVPVVQMERTA